MPIALNLNRLLIGLYLLAAIAGRPTLAQDFKANYDESQIPEYQLPAILDDRVDSPGYFKAAWPPRRAHLLDVFAEQMYGRQPKSPFKMACERFESGESLGGKAQRQQFHITLSTTAAVQRFDLLVFTPATTTEQVPCFLGLNFYGNHTVAKDEEISIPTSWSRQTAEQGVVNNHATAAGRGKASSRWDIDAIIDAGFGVATVYCGDIDPDFDDDFQNGVHALFPEYRPSVEHPDRWGTIAAWAWGLSRALDCLQSNVPEVAGERVVVIGHSRLGKTALWAGATDERFAGVISNNSGCGGAALSRRAIGETVGRINDSFPHWFCPNFKQYNLNEASLPMDQHQLIALLAPRPVYVASATADTWADPKGEFLAAKLGGEIYARFGLKPLALNDLPPPNTASIGPVSYHLREGKHDVTDWDWKNYIDFMMLLRKP